MDDGAADPQPGADMPIAEAPMAEQEDMDMGQAEGQIGQAPQMDELQQQQFGGIDPNQ